MRVCDRLHNTLSLILPYIISYCIIILINHLLTSRRIAHATWIRYSRRMDLQRIYDKCDSLSQRFTRFKFPIIFINLYFLILVAYEVISKKLSSLYKKWTTFGLSD